MLDLGAHSEGFHLSFHRGSFRSRTPLPPHQFSGSAHHNPHPHRSQRRTPRVPWIFQCHLCLGDLDDIILLVQRFHPDGVSIIGEQGGINGSVQGKIIPRFVVILQIEQLFPPEFPSTVWFTTVEEQDLFQGEGIQPQPHRGDFSKMLPPPGGECDLQVDRVILLTDCDDEPCILPHRDPDDPDVPGERFRPCSVIVPYPEGDGVIAGSQSR